MNIVCRSCENCSHFTPDDNEQNGNEQGGICLAFMDATSPDNTCIYWRKDDAAL